MDLNEVLKQFEAVEANLGKLDQVWKQIKKTAALYRPGASWRRGAISTDAAFVRADCKTDAEN
jgi:hypothetical protein